MRTVLSLSHHFKDRKEHSMEATELLLNLFEKYFGVPAAEIEIANGTRAPLGIVHDDHHTVYATATQASHDLL